MNPPVETWRILLVEDDEEDYLIMREMLKQAQGRKFSLEWASSFPEGQVKLASERYDAALIDYDLGARTGIEFIHEFVDQGCATPLILYTGHGSYEIDMEAMRAGATLYLIKSEANPLALERSIRYSIERKQTEIAIRQSESKLRALFDLLPVGVSVLSERRTVIDVNPALERILSLSKDEMLSGKHRNRIYLRADGTPLPPEAIPSVQAFDQQRPVENVELGIVKEDGQTVWATISAIPLPYPDWRMLVVTTDISARKQAEEARQAAIELLEQSNQALEDFAFIASHDLHEPLRKIQSLGERLNTGYQQALDEEGRGYVNGVIEAAARLNGMLSNLLDYSRASRTGMPFDAVDLRQTALDVISDLELNIQTAQAQIELGDLPEIEADPLQIYQLFQNLLSNAIKYHHPNQAPHIRVYSQTDGHSLNLIVEDDGIGFEPDFAEEIFRPFFRLQDSSEYEGAGIGLATCQKIVQRHKGSIRAESAPGQGAKFTVCLPLKQK